ncbi:phenylacetate--CoA ligase family protein [Saccharopolyspora sp. ASAGF58]|uniref:phenylacetate--CoA ligase family protein n=1 Tax=Saccharopolyspora sp. ASAGF58 TaxID=2719023 RepID=UPI00143FDEA5|nr:AMP-binding protein [Saccharopolyspora sp. ASAGF58]QIZ38820.1 phenylacetate--CoA ligase family protein [Saccharopolyspora sp. ASAGF58]
MPLNAAGDPDRPVASKIRLAADPDRLDRAELERLRERNFAAMVDAALATPAVRRRWPDLAPGMTTADLARLPLLSSRELADGSPPHSPEFQLGGDGPGMVLRSSGTASKPKMMYHSWDFNLQVGRLGARGLLAATRSAPARRVANCFYPAELSGGAFLFTQEVIRLAGARSYPLASQTSPAESAAVIAEHRVDALAANPGYGVELLTRSPPGQIAALRYFFYIGELLGKARTQAIAEAAPQVAVRSLAYSTSETGPIGYQCEQLSGATHHVHEDAVVVEIVDEQTGVPVPDGDTGEVIVTALSDTGMALFRYRIGDAGSFGTAPCPCGSPARLLTLHGRTATSLNIDTEVVSSDLLLGQLGRLGVTEPADCQLQVLPEQHGHRLRLLLSSRTPEWITTQAVVDCLSRAQQLRAVLNSAQCLGFSVERVAPELFARTDRGKVPVLYAPDSRMTPKEQ